jgi:putative FmdB family regulatory protein
MYQYACDDCGFDFERVQSFHDDPLSTCPECGGTVRRVIAPVGIIFKGSGWYITDSRRQISSGKATSDKGASDSTASDNAGAEKPAATADASGGDASGASGTSGGAAPKNSTDGASSGEAKAARPPKKETAPAS